MNKLYYLIIFLILNSCAYMPYDPENPDEYNRYWIQEEEYKEDNLINIFPNECSREDEIIKRNTPPCKQTNSKPSIK